MTKRGQRQHTITEWHLRSFAHSTASGPELDYYDLQEGAFGRQVASTFMAPINDHSREIELELQRIETPASRAARHLLSAAADVDPGFYALADATWPATGEQFREGGTFEGMSILISERRLARASRADEIALAKFLVLMYSRSPKHEAAATATARVYGSAVLRTLRAMGVPLTSNSFALVDETVESARWFGLRHADELAEVLRSRFWWLAVASHESPFIIGDSPVVSAIAVGHDADWQPLAGDQFGILAFPLSPSVALLISGPLVPITIEPTEIVPWINRTTLRWADRYVAAHDRAAIESILAGSPEPMARVAFPAHPQAWWQQGVGAAIHVVVAPYIDEQFLTRDVYHPPCRSTQPIVVWATKRLHDV